MHFEPGDLLIFYGRDFSSRVIEWATRGPSHVGIVCPHTEGVEESKGSKTSKGSKMLDRSSTISTLLTLRLFLDIRIPL